MGEREYNPDMLPCERHQETGQDLGALPAYNYQLLGHSYDGLFKPLQILTFN